MCSTMADQSLYSPINPHFFQPLLQGFRTHLNIPVAFFSKHVEGRNDQNKTAKLRSDASDQTWLVKIDGLKFTDGWEDFSFAHDLQVGDIIVFRHEGEMVFHVTVLGPSCCEIQYTSSNNNDDAQTNTVTGNSSRDKRVKMNPRTEVVSSSDHSRFVAHVSPSSLRLDRLVRYLPLAFAKSSGLNKMSGKKIVLLNEEGRSWSLDLIYNKSGMHTFIRPGWRRFCAENRIGKGHLCPFKLVQKSGPPILRLCRKPESEASSHHSCFGGSVTPSSLNKDKLYLPRGFVIANGLDRDCSEIVLKNEWGGRWTLALKHYESLNQTFLRPGWTSFCHVNGIKAGDSFKFELVGTGKKPVLYLCPAHSNRGKTVIECPEGSDGVTSLSSNTSSGDDCGKSESDEESSGDENFSQDRLEVEKKKNWSRYRGSSSNSQNKFVTLTLTSYALNKYKLTLPLSFTRENGIDKPGKVTLLGRDGVKRVVDLYKDKKDGRMRLGKGWREFCEAHSVKIHESFVLELIWEEEASPVLKFCTKLNSV